MQPEDTRMQPEDTSEIPCHGITQIPCQFKHSGWINTDFFIVDVTGPADVGLPTCEKLKLVTLHCAVKKTPSNTVPVNSVSDLQKMYPNQFDMIGKFKGEYQIGVEPEVLLHVTHQEKHQLH